MTYTVIQDIAVEAGHRLTHNPKSKCKTIHGHNFVFQFHISCIRGLNQDEMVIDFSDVKQVIKGWMDVYFDHTMIVNQSDTRTLAFLEEDYELGCALKRPFRFDGDPTSENLAKFMLGKASELLSRDFPNVQVDKVRVWETPNCSASYEINLDPCD